MASETTVRLVGTHGNVQELLVKVTRAMREQGQNGKLTEMVMRVNKATSYMEAVAIALQYVTVY